MEQMSRNQLLQAGLAVVVSGVIAGCGGGGDGASAPQAEVGAAAPAVASSESAEQTKSQETVIRPAGLTASIEKPSAASQEGAEKSPAAVGGKSAFPDDEATKTLREVQQLRVSPLPNDVEKARETRRERNERIVDMATRVIRLTMEDESRKPQFQAAISHLLEARFQTALTGTEEDIDALYSDVQALNDRDPKSTAAAEGVYYIARFAHTKASLTGNTQPVWFETLSRWAREFADRFPDQQKRATTLLFGAGRSCELHAVSTKDQELSKRLMTESQLCYTTLAEKFPNSDQGQEATASLRRLAVTGQTLTQFSGPTVDGGYVTSDEFSGKPTLIYFWESESDEFVQEMLPELEKIRAQLPSDRLRMVGVAMDEEEGALNAWLESHSVPGQQIFFPNAEQRSWNSPLVRFWGIATCPSIWVVDANGKVVSTNVKLDDLVPTLRQALKKP
jgi:thiol-disulfide isomerase/thioredoxin